MVRIAASLKEETQSAVSEIAALERRSFSQMVDILLTEAIEHRNPKKEIDAPVKNTGKRSRKNK